MCIFRRPFRWVKQLLAAWVCLQVIVLISGFCADQEVPLGLSTGRIKQHQISATSNNQKLQNGEMDIRLGLSDTTPASPTHDNPAPEILIAIDELTISSIDIQGNRMNGTPGQYAQHVFFEFFEVTLHRFIRYRRKDDVEKLPANVDAHSIARIKLDPVIGARLIKIIPISTTMLPCLKMELNKCSLITTDNSGEILWDISYGNFLAAAGITVIFVPTMIYLRSLREAPVQATHLNGGTQLTAMN